MNEPDDSTTAVAEPDDGIRVTGGAGGTRARVETLITAAARADQAAEHLEEAAALVWRAVVLVEKGASSSPATAAAVRDAARPLLFRARGLGMRAIEARLAAAGLREAARTYLLADLDVNAMMLRAGVTAAGYAIGAGGPAGVMTAAGVTVGSLALAGGFMLSSRILRYTPAPAGLGLRILGSERMRERDGFVGYVARMVGGPGLVPEDFGLPHASTLETLLPGVAATIIGLHPGAMLLEEDPVAQAARLLGAMAGVVGGMLGTARGGLVVAPVVTPIDAPASGRDRPQPEPPRDITDLLRAVDRAYDSGGDGSVVVQRLDHEDGRRTWVVAVPGTQATGFGGPTATDNQTNLDAVAGVPDDMSHTVITAMLQAGVGPDEPVVLAGHSQGGMVAMRVAAGTTKMFSVTAVLTAGSPVGAMPVPDSVQVLSLEHVQDFVCAAEGLPNPDETNRTTVTRDLAAGPTVDQGTAGVPSSGTVIERLVDAVKRPHELTEYIGTTERVVGSSDRSVLAFEASVAGVLGTGAARVTEQRYIGVRVASPRDPGDPGVGTWSVGVGNLGARRVVGGTGVDGIGVGGRTRP